MKPFLIAAALSLGLCSCSESTPVVQILQTIQPDESCSFGVNDTGIANGSLNLAYRNGYLLGLVVKSNYSSTPIDVNGVPLEPDSSSGGSATAFVDTLKLSYASTPSIRIPDGEVPYTATINPASDTNRFVVNLMTAEAASALRTALSGTATATVRVTAQFTGKFASGGKKFESNEIIFGIDVANGAGSLRTCATGEDPEVPEGPCGSGAGQDGQAPSCQPGPAAPIVGG
ncbi:MULTISPECIES: hypothetical protein [Corallococcus]|uniref:hypothetical protein n=1 Tax=Corallococcus TaxID=83461 RepID=UPI000EE3B54E|nr:MULTISPECIES: hypothetical protein [Corallococcus]NPC75034.1 hypothetical protein [Corallococcus exiguus]NPD29507.1 hypothetical protein [Corallococcus exiguus]RKH98761.1 hypothetical protein D7Y04_22660 [Corallococcus sp. AB038B]